MRSRGKLLAALVSAGLSGPGLPASASSAGDQRPPVAYLWDSAIFPLDENGQVLLDGDYKRIYRTTDPGIPAYDRPSGRIVGRIGPACTGPTCDDPDMVLVRPGRSTLVVPQDEWGYEVRGLVTGDPVRFEGERAWARIRPAEGTAKDAVWVSVRKADVHFHVNLATSVRAPDTWCSAPGRCRPFTRAETKAFAAAEAAREGLCSSVYSIQGVKARGARRYYAVEHRKDEGDPGAPPLPAILPTKGYVPVLNRSGFDIGYFYARGC
jgi:hypothetical protein